MAERRARCSGRDLHELTQTIPLARCAECGRRLEPLNLLEHEGEVCVVISSLLKQERSV